MSDDPALQLKATQQFRRLLSIGSYIRTCIRVTWRTYRHIFFYIQIYCPDYVSLVHNIFERTHMYVCGCVVSYTYMSDNFIVQEIQIEFRVVNAIRKIKNVVL
jgi:hypothetical protein